MFGFKTIGNAVKGIGKGVVEGAKAIGQGAVATAKVIGKGVQKVAPIVQKVGDVVGNVAGVGAKLAGALGQPEFAAPLMGVAKGAKAVAGVAGAVGHVGKAVEGLAGSRSAGEVAGHLGEVIGAGRNAHQMYRGGREDIQFGRHAGQAILHRGRELYRR